MGEGDAPLTDTQTRDLAAVAAMMIPASGEYAVPAADDAAIFADVLASIGTREAAPVRAALDQLAELAAVAGGAFADLPAARQEAVAAEWRAEGGQPLATLSRVVLQCYYRDDRVVRSLGQEPRPPFPLGHTLEQGDWSLLDPVRARPPFWRPDRR